MLKIFLQVIAICSCLVVSVSANDLSYRDVDENAWYYEDVKISTEEGILKGKSEEEFCPNSNLKVSEALTVAVKAYAKLNNETLHLEFNDNWYIPYVSYAISKGIIVQNEFLNFNQDITRSEFAKICYRILNNKNYALNNVEFIPDLDVNDENYTDIQMLYNLGIITGVDEYGSFHPNECITRAQMATVLSRIIHPERRVKKEYKLAESVRYKIFREKVVNQECTGNQIFVSCDTQTVSQENLTKLQAEINKFNGVCGFYMITLDGKFSIGYNIDKSIPSASTVKAPFSLYSMKQIENGYGTLDEKRVYESKHYCAGSGVIQYSKVGTEYTLEQVLYHTINVSDNTGYYMLQDKFGISGYNDYLESIGCEKMKLTGGIRWGYIYPREAALIWNEIYNYSKTSSYGEKLFELFVNAKYNFIKNAYLTKYASLDYEIAHKSGFNPNGRHDQAIVLREDVPYFIVITTKPKDNGSEKTFFNNTALILESIMQDYISQISK